MQKPKFSGVSVSNIDKSFLKILGRQKVSAKLLSQGWDLREFIKDYGRDNCFLYLWDAMASGELWMFVVGRESLNTLFELPFCAEECAKLIGAAKAKVLSAPGENSRKLLCEAMACYAVKTKAWEEAVKRQEDKNIHFIAMTYDFGISNQMTIRPFVIIDEDTPLSPTRLECSCLQVFDYDRTHNPGFFPSAEIVPFRK